MGFIDILRNRSVATKMGARILSGLQGNVTFPRQTGKVTVTWQGGRGHERHRGRPGARPALDDAEDVHRDHRRLGAAPRAGLALGGSLRDGRPRERRRDRRRRRGGHQRHGRRAAPGHQEHHRHHERPGLRERDLRQDPGVRLDRRRLECHPRQSGLGHQHRRRGEADASAALHEHRLAAVDRQHARRRAGRASMPCRPSNWRRAT
jgi:hypothetical protein